MMEMRDFLFLESNKKKKSNAGLLKQMWRCLRNNSIFFWPKQSVTFQETYTEYNDHSVVMHVKYYQDILSNRGVIDL